ncbi:MAG: YciC family protein [Candidatus Bathyarchaeia archaeon]
MASTNFVARKISVLEILDKSFSVYFAKMEMFYAIFLILNIINAVLVHAITDFIPSLSVPSELPGGVLSWLVNYGVSAIMAFSISILIIWLITNFGNSIVIGCVSEILEGRRVEITKNLKLTFHLSGRLLMVSLVVGALVVLGFILLIFPGLIMAIIFSLSTPVMVIERLGALDSLRRSKEMSDNMWWKIFLLLAALFAMFVLSYLVAEALSIILYRYYRQILVRHVIRILLITLVEPLYPISITHLYYGLRWQRMARPLPSVHEERYLPIQEAKFCYYCGQLLPYDALYCPNCGRRL